MKNALAMSVVVFAVAVSAPAFAGVSAERVMARQNWPWTPDVRVSYVLAGAAGPVDVNPVFYDGDVEIAWSGEGLTGDVYGVSGNHDHSFMIDVRKAFPSMPPSWRRPDASKGDTRTKR